LDADHAVIMRTINNQSISKLNYITDLSFMLILLSACLYICTLVYCRVDAILTEWF